VLEGDSAIDLTKQFREGVESRFQKLLQSVLKSLLGDLSTLAVASNLM
jgi:hypothetical protein